jgi:hypothetical protein
VPVVSAIVAPLVVCDVALPTLVECKRLFRFPKLENSLAFTIGNILIQSPDSRAFLNRRSGTDSLIVLYPTKMDRTFVLCLSDPQRSQSSKLFTLPREECRFGQFCQGAQLASLILEGTSHTLLMCPFIPHVKHVLPIGQLRVVCSSRAPQVKHYVRALMDQA